MDRDLRFVFDVETPVVSRLECLDRQIDVVRQVADEARRRVDGICEMANESDRRHRHYVTHLRRWQLHRRRYDDWAEESSDILDVAGYLRTALVSSTADRNDPQMLGMAREARREASRIVRRLKDKRANRRNRRIYYDGLALVWGALDLIQNGHVSKDLFDADFVPLGSLRPPGDAHQEIVPKYTPRYECFDRSGWCRDTLTMNLVPIPESRFDGDMDAVRSVPIVPGRSQISSQYREAMRSIADLGFRAFRVLRGDCDAYLEDSILDSALWELTHNLYGPPPGIIPLTLIASTAPVDADKPSENLRSHAAVFKTYRLARDEYREAPMLGMIVRMGRKLWIVHDDADLPLPAGHPRVTCANPDGGGTWVFEPLAAFRKSAKSAWGWFKEEDDYLFARAP